ncbi:GDT1 family protein [Haematococcus lacustris]|uniref:GDT1 family protein n=1 Tax=Haematococcus lacustris TaxID=44745 RepID=A0A699YT55_HAELA|nr:GDT1 family protein [Haematococcus lacustris]
MATSRCAISRHTMALPLSAHAHLCPTQHRTIRTQLVGRCLVASSRPVAHISAQWPRSLRAGALPEAASMVQQAANTSVGDLAEASKLVIPGLLGDNQLREGFVSGFLLIFFSEIGDKTFFIALLLALRNSRSAVFIGTLGALSIMTVISVLLGRTLHLLDEAVPFDNTPLAGVPIDDLLAAGLLIWFGIQTLRGAAADTLKLILSTFTLVFAAEWGDKSFLATIALGAASSPLGVAGGAVAGHGVATALAVAGGAVLTRYFSPKYMGGALFLVFAAATLVDVATGAHS